MQLIKIILTTIGSVAALFLSAKVIGNKQMSQLNMFDYINGITIGSIGAEMATSIDGSFYYPLTAIAIYTFIIWFISYAGSKNIKFRRFFSGRSIFLMRGGKIYEKNFKKVNIDINEFLTQCRINGYFHLCEIDTAIMEQNGQISVMPRSRNRPVTPKDVGMNIPEERYDIVVITDGHILEKNLVDTGNNRSWLEKELIRLKIGSMRDIFIGVCDEKNNLTVFKKNGEVYGNDVFQ